MKTQTEHRVSRSGTKRFLRFSLIYALGDILTKGAQIVLLPFYISMLSPHEVGMLAILTTVVMAVWQLSSLGLGFAIQRFYYEQNDESRDQFVFSLWLTRFLVGIPLVAVAIAVISIAHPRIETSIPLYLICLALLSGFLKGGLNLLEAWLVIREQPVQYRTFTFLQFTSTTALVILLIAYFGMGVAGAIIGELVSLTVWTVISGLLLLRKSLPKIRNVRWKEVIAYSAPALPHILFMWGLSAVDRIMLEQFGVPLGQIGIYDTGYKLASFLSLIIMSMRAAWLPNYFKTALKQAAQEKYVSMAMLFSFIVTFGALAIFLFAPNVITIVNQIAHGDYSDATAIIRIVVLGFLAFGFFVVCNQPLFYQRKVVSIACTSGLGLFVNLIANFILIPQMGIEGAAWSTAIAYAFIAVTMFVLVTRSQKFNWPIKLLVTNLAVAACLAITGWLIPSGWGWALMAKFCLLATFPAVALFGHHRLNKQNALASIQFGASK